MLNCGSFIKFIDDVTIFIMIILLTSIHNLLESKLQSFGCLLSILHTETWKYSWCHMLLSEVSMNNISDDCYSLPFLRYYQHCYCQHQEFIKRCSNAHSILHLGLCHQQLKLCKLFTVKVVQFQSGDVLDLDDVIPQSNNLTTRDILKDKHPHFYNTSKHAERHQHSAACTLIVKALVVTALSTLTYLQQSL